MTRGHCTNLPSRCDKAKSKELLPVTGPRTACPTCGKPVRPVKEASKLSPVMLAAAGVVILLAGLLVWLLVGRESPEAPVVASTRPQAATGFSCDRNPLLVLNGSDVLGQTLAPELVRAWLGANDVQGVNINRAGATTEISGKKAGETCRVLIQGPNSEDGFSALREGAADVAMSALQLTPEQARDMRELGDMTSPEAEHVAAIDALAVIVHPSNSVASLTRGELADIIAGKVTRWDALKGPAGEISTFIAGSGVRAADTTGELIGPVADRVQRSASDAGVIEAVASDPRAIGIVSYPAPAGVRTIAIGEQGATPFAPSSDTINTQAYPLTRRLYFYVDPTPANPNTKKFIDFVQGREGQAVVGRTGYGSQNVEVVAAPAVRPDASSEYRSLVANARQLNIALRFRTGRSELDNKALEDLDRLLTFLSLDQDRGGLLLIGFADAQGDEAANQELSRQRAETVAAALRQRGIQEVSPRWFGEEQPVGDNSTVAGREKNRRVEVWMVRGSTS